MPDTEQLLTTAEAAKAIYVSRATLLRMVQAGRIEPALKLDGVRGAFLFSPTEVERARAAIRT